MRSEALAKEGKSEQSKRKDMNPAKFIREVRQENNKVSWPTRREVVASTITVLLLTTFAALFFLLVDAVISNTVEWILGL
jgi:preprotein translocase subunit SecE